MTLVPVPDVISTMIRSFRCRGTEALWNTGTCVGGDQAIGSGTERPAQVVEALAEAGKRLARRRFWPEQSGHPGAGEVPARVQG